MPPRPENRKKSRHSMQRGACIIIGAHQQPLPCVILDMSDGGARLSFANPLTTLPHNVTLVLFKDRSVQRDCEVVWVDRTQLGVKFASGWYGPLR